MNPPQPSTRVADVAPSPLALSAARQSLGDLLRRSRRRFPDRLAVQCGEIRWTYAEFDDLCTTLAAGLAGEGVQPGDRVAIISRNSHAFAALRFALARLGAVLVPINFMLGADEARYILEHSGATRLFVDSSFAALGEEASRGTAVGQRYWLPSERPGERRTIGSAPCGRCREAAASLERTASPGETCRPRSRTPEPARCRAGASVGAAIRIPSRVRPDRGRPGRGPRDTPLSVRELHGRARSGAGRASRDRRAS